MSQIDKVKSTDTINRLTGQVNRAIDKINTLDTEKGDVFLAGWEEGEYGVFPKDIDVPYATDDDFSGTTDGTFKYIGTETTVKIPHVIKGVPVTSYSYMFAYSNVSKVISTNKNVTDMGNMFFNSKATSLNLSSFDTSNVTDMGWMFQSSKATSLDLSSFDTSNVTDMSWMFTESSAIIGYARTQADTDNFNVSSGKPAWLTFVVHPDLV